MIEITTINTVTGQRELIATAETLAEAKEKVEALGVCFMEDDADHPNCADAYLNDGRVVAIQPQGFSNLSQDPQEWLREQFEFEWCAECGRDHRHHTAVPFIGNWFARCDLEPVVRIANGREELVVNPEGYPEGRTD